MKIPSIEKAGETMSTQAIQNVGDPISGRSEKMQDLLPVSSFGLWAALLGIAPVLVFRVLMAK